MTNIELVIKIPEEIRLALINNIQLSIDQQSICDSYTKHAIINGTPLSKELEKLKEDILNLGFTGWAYKPKLDREEVLTILDKHISKLKGE